VNARSMSQYMRTPSPNNLLSHNVLTPVDMGGQGRYKSPLGDNSDQSSNNCSPNSSSPKHQHLISNHSCSDMGQERKLAGASPVVNGPLNISQYSEVPMNQDN